MGDTKHLERPEWIRVKTAPSEDFSTTLNVIRNRKVHTVCEEALCPNINECWKNKTATFLIMGEICTRNCGFCNVKTGVPSKLDSNEPENIAKSVQDLGIKYAVITSVTRDDLKDGGAVHFAEVIKKIKELNPEAQVEILIPDFKGDEEAIRTIVEAKPDVFGHNIEIVKRLHSSVKKPPAKYDLSMTFLKNVKKIDKNTITKTGLIVGVGENKEEVFEVIDDAVNASINIITIGQYLTPSTSHYPIAKYISLEEFDEYKEYGENKGIKVISGPLVRSSYKARETYSSICHIK
jgi:lipoic acid synthetase